MGDSARFRLMADLIERHFDPALSIADVAGGKGHLQAELYRRGFRSVTSWDKRGKYAGPRRNYRHALFDWRNAPRGYDLVVGMHPDGATDHIIGYATKHRRPFVICPCCVVPSAFKYEGYEYRHWIDHLERLACNAGFRVAVHELPMSGRNIVLRGMP